MKSGKEIQSTSVMRHEVDKECEDREIDRDREKERRREGSERSAKADNSGSKRRETARVPSTFCVSDTVGSVRLSRQREWEHEMRGRRTEREREGEEQVEWRRETEEDRGRGRERG